MSDKKMNDRTSDELRSLDRNFNGSITSRMDGETEKPVFELSLSSEIAYDRGDYKEILVHSADSVNLDRAADRGLPLLHNHRTDELIGRVDDVRVEDGKLRGAVKFGNSQLAKDIEADVRDGIRSDVSIGYRWDDWTEDTKTGEVSVTRWTLHEASIVGVPADYTVGMGRSNETTRTEDNSKMSENEVKQDIPANDEAVRAAATVASQSAVAQERKRVSDVTDYCNKRGMPEMAPKAVSEGWSMDDTRERVLDAKDKAADAKPAATSGELREEKAKPIGLTTEDIDSIRIVDIVNYQLNPADSEAKRKAGHAIEASQQFIRKNNLPQPKGIVIPPEALSRFMTKGMTRDLSAGTATDGAELVSTDLLSGSLIEVLRNRSVVLGLGAVTLEGLVGDVAIPRVTSGSASAWISTEGGNAAQSDPQFDQVTMSPKTAGTYTEVTRQLLSQSSVGLEAFLRNDMAQGMATLIDAAALYGSGSSGQPTGVANTSGINAPTAFAAAVPTFAEVIAMETAVDVDNALMGTLAYLTDPTTRGGLKSADKGTDTGQFVWMGNEVNGYNAVVSNQVTAGDVFFGNWADLIIGMWGGLDILVDPYTNSLSGTVRIVAHQSMDVAVRHAVSFAFNNDT